MREITSFSRMEFGMVSPSVGATTGTPILDNGPLETKEAARKEGMAKFKEMANDPRCPDIMEVGGLNNIVTVRVYLTDEGFVKLAFTTKEKPGVVLQRQATQPKPKAKKKGFTKPVRPARPKPVRVKATPTVEKVKLTPQQIFDAAMRQRAADARRKFAGRK